MNLFQVAFFFVILVIALALVRSWRALADLRLWRRITRQSSVPVRDLQPGPAMIRGRVRLVGDPVKLPGTDDACVAYEIVEPIRLGSTRQSASFVVEDATGAVEVRASDMRVAGPVDRVLRIDSSGMKTMPGLARPVRVLHDGDEIFLVGLAQREADPTGQAGSYREAPTKMVIRPGGPVGLAAVREASSLVKYALPTLVVSAILIFGLTGGVFALASTFMR
jgi:hypothetical protein